MNANRHYVQAELNFEQTMVHMYTKENPRVCIQNIAKIVHRTSKTVRAILEKHGVPIKSDGGQKVLYSAEQKRRVATLYLTHTVDEICHLENLSNTTVKDFLTELNAYVRRFGESIDSGFDQETSEMIMHMIFNQEVFARVIAYQFGCSRGKVELFINGQGFEMRSPGARKGTSKFDPNKALELEVFYFVRIHFDKGTLIKMGQMELTVKVRFHGLSKPLETIGQWKFPHVESFFLENEVLTQFKNFQTWGLKGFSGRTECLCPSVETLVMTYLKKVSHKESYLWQHKNETVLKQCSFLSETVGFKYFKVLKSNGFG